MVVGGSKEIGIGWWSLILIQGRRWCRDVEVILNSRGGYKRKSNKRRDGQTGQSTSLWNAIADQDWVSSPFKAGLISARAGGRCWGYNDAVRIKGRFNSTNWKILISWMFRDPVTSLPLRDTLQRSLCRRLKVNLEIPGVKIADLITLGWKK